VRATDDEPSSELARRLPSSGADDAGAGWRGPPPL